MRIKIEMEVGNADPSQVLEMAQELAIELNEIEGDELSETDKEIIRDDVSVEIVCDDPQTATKEWFKTHG